jgi:hypothetical protein
MAAPQRAQAEACIEVRMFHSQQPSCMLPFPSHPERDRLYRPYLHQASFLKESETNDRRSKLGSTLLEVCNITVAARGSSCFIIVCSLDAADWGDSESDWEL